MTLLLLRVCECVCVGCGTESARNTVRVLCDAQEKLVYQLRSLRRHMYVAFTHCAPTLPLCLG